MASQNPKFFEGPLWLKDKGVLLFSNIPANTIYKLTPPSTIEVFLQPSGNSNGLNLDPMGRIVVCEHSGRRISRIEANGNVTSVASMWMGKKLNSPNDLVVRSDGTLYFTDPPYGLPQNTPSEYNAFGVFRVAPGGAMSAVAMDMKRPNGVVLSGDEKLLYVSDSETPEVRVFPVNDDGSTGQGSVLIQRTSDGMAIDDAGNLYLSNNAGIEVFRPDGTKWGAIPLPNSQTPTNASFGGPDRKTLYITSGSSLYHVNVNVPGKP